VKSTTLIEKQTYCMTQRPQPVKVQWLLQPVAIWQENIFLKVLHLENGTGATTSKIELYLSVDCHSEFKKHIG
jgi:hypothetical protein